MNENELRRAALLAAVSVLSVSLGVGQAEAISVKGEAASGQASGKRQGAPSEQFKMKLHSRRHPHHHHRHHGPANAVKTPASDITFQKSSASSQGKY